MTTQRETHFSLGYRHGSDSEQPDSRGVFNREAYYDGYIRGTEDRGEPACLAARATLHAPTG
jgi:hypothetical protein